MDIQQIAEVAGLAIAVGGLIFGAGKFSENVKANTRMTEKLSDALDKHFTWSAQVVKEHDERFHDHDKRIESAHNRIDNLENKRR